MKPNLVLFGFMGTGKSATGRAVARRLGKTFVDMDHEIEARQGRPIPEIFAGPGESFFRQCERDLVRELAARDGLVVATGGGVVLNPDNLADFGRKGVLICLRARPETILARVGRNPHRPLLAVADPVARIRQLLEARRSLYASIPLAVDTDGLEVAQVAAQVADLYAAHAGAAER
jgi:shikimate kinase